MAPAHPRSPTDPARQELTNPLAAASTPTRQGGQPWRLVAQPGGSLRGLEARTDGSLRGLEARTDGSLRGLEARTDGSPWERTAPGARVLAGSAIAVAGRAAQGSGKRSASAGAASPPRLPAKRAEQSEQVEWAEWAVRTRQAERPVRGTPRQAGSPTPRSPAPPKTATLSRRRPHQVAPPDRPPISRPRTDLGGHPTPDSPGSVTSPLSNPAPSVKMDLTAHRCDRPKPPLAGPRRGYRRWSRLATRTRRRTPGRCVNLASPRAPPSTRPKT